MNWFRLPFRLHQRGVLGINRRNADALLPHNPRSLFPIVDNKKLLHDLCQRLNIPTPQIYDCLVYQGEIHQFLSRLVHKKECVLKPALGSGGRGVILIRFTSQGECLGANGVPLPVEELRKYLADGISGAFSLGGRTDQILAQERIGLHSSFHPIVPEGIPDLRIILYRGVPAMAMLRLPTRASKGRANLHQGGLGLGVDLQTGITFQAISDRYPRRHHPDTNAPLLGIVVPDWQKVLSISSQVARALGLGLLGIDIVFDPTRGPLLLEANARPGLNIQIANDAGLYSRFQEIDSFLDG